MQSTIMIMAMVAFFAIYIIIGRITQRKVKTSEDFHIAGREMGFLPTALSTAATDMAVSGLSVSADSPIVWGLPAVYGDG